MDVRKEGEDGGKTNKERKERREIEGGMKVGAKKNGMTKRR